MSENGATNLRPGQLRRPAADGARSFGWCRRRSGRRKRWPGRLGSSPHTLTAQIFVADGVASIEPLLRASGANLCQAGAFKHPVG